MNRIATNLLQEQLTLARRILSAAAGRSRDRGRGRPAPRLRDDRAAPEAEQRDAVPLGVAGRDAAGAGRESARVLSALRATSGRVRRRRASSRQLPGATPVGG